MIRLLALSAAVMLLAACATGDQAGIRDPDEFRRVALRDDIRSPVAPADVARCFEERAALLPMSRFGHDAESSRWTYRLRGYGFTFEEIEFVGAPGGSRITTYLAPNLSHRWRSDFERDRLLPLRQCAGLPG